MAKLIEIDVDSLRRLTPEEVVQLADLLNQEFLFWRRMRLRLSWGYLFLSATYGGLLVVDHTGTSGVVNVLFMIFWAVLSVFSFRGTK